ncbi:uncharacterized protein TNCV_186291 [Trichonephila clavipes]|nr:uncharacterized protein TNCV_186291 [Trichonephila clavipes]
MLDSIPTTAATSWRDLNRAKPRNIKLVPTLQTHTPPQWDDFEHGFKTCIGISIHQVCIATRARIHNFTQSHSRVFDHDQHSSPTHVAAVAEWYRYRTVACFVTGSSPVPLKTRRVGQRCTLNLSRAETSSRWCGVVVRRGGGASSGVVHVT